MARNIPIINIIKPKDLFSQQISTNAGVIFDSTPKKFGDVYLQPNKNYKVG
jgi:hypothetical protein